MSCFTLKLRPDGRDWTPRFVQDINDKKCIGCGRCFRVCGRDVLQLVGIDCNGDRLALAIGEDDDYDDDSEYEKKIMTIAHPENCIGCEACSRICPKKCYTHAPMTDGG